MLNDFLTKYPHYKIEEVPSEKVIESYAGRLPEFILEVWRKYGWGIFMNDYLRFINPADFQDFTDEYVEKVDADEAFTPFAVTAFGDVIGYASRGKVEFYDFRHSNFEVLSSEKYLANFFNKDMIDSSFIWKELKAEQYQEAVSKLGIPDYDKCFGYVPLLAFGGNESVDKIQIVGLQAHLEIMAQAVGSLEQSYSLSHGVAWLKPLAFSPVSSRRPTYLPSAGRSSARVAETETRCGGSRRRSAADGNRHPRTIWLRHLPRLHLSIRWQSAGRGL